jgi:hypothetical protein
MDRQLWVVPVVCIDIRHVCEMFYDDHIEIITKT